MLTTHDVGHGYCRVGADGIADLRLVCSGWIPVPSPALRGAPGGR
jgi:hypothetical protein